MLAIANVNQDIETALKQDKSEGAMALLDPIVATPVRFLTGSGIVRGMHVGSYAPSQYTSTPLKMYFFDVYLVHI